MNESRTQPLAPRVAIYARVSSEHQAQEQTISSQVAALRERVASDGLLLDEELCFLDDGVTGTTLARPALEKLRDRFRCYILPSFLHRSVSSLVNLVRATAAHAPLRGGESGFVSVRRSKQRLQNLRVGLVVTPGILFLSACPGLRRRLARGASNGDNRTRAASGVRPRSKAPAVKFEL